LGTAGGSGEEEEETGAEGEGEHGEEEGRLLASSVRCSGGASRVGGMKRGGDAPTDGEGSQAGGGRKRSIQGNQPDRSWGARAVEACVMIGGERRRKAGWKHPEPSRNVMHGETEIGKAVLQSRGEYGAIATQVVNQLNATLKQSKRGGTKETPQFPREHRNRTQKNHYGNEP
jgi:hypothetical protein